MAPTEKYGLFRLHPEPRKPYNADDFSVDIVAIHGLGGNPMNTWTDKDGHLWLRDSLPSHIPRARIMTFGYDSSILLGKSRMTINDFAVDLTNRLEDERQQHQELNRPLIFICHSLGGVVFKEFLVFIALFDEYIRIRESVSGVVFMGTPHRGSKAASTAQVLSKIINAATLGSLLRTDLLRTLKVASAELETISRHATHRLKHLSVISFYEKKPLGATLIVESYSAILGISNERAIPINADHRKIAKVSPRREQRYHPVWASIKKLVEGSLVSSYTHNDSQRILDYLYCVDYKMAQIRPGQPQRGTSQWIFADPTYLSWLNSSHPSVLMLAGQPGSGKSVLTRCLLESMISGGGSKQHSTSNYLGINFFCSYFESAINSEEVVLRSLLHQLIQLNSYCGQIIRNCLEKQTKTGPKLSLERSGLRHALFEVLSMDAMKHVFIVIDAIEELGSEIAMSTLSGLCKVSQDLSERHPESRLKVFVSSRPNPAYLSAMPNLTILSMKNAQTRRDIEAYLEAVMEDFATENSDFDAVASSSTRHNIITQIMRISDGMFLSALKDLLQDACDGRSRADLVSDYSFLLYASESFLYQILKIPYDDSLWLEFSDLAAKYSIYTLKSLKPDFWMYVDGERHTMNYSSPLKLVIDKVPPPAKESLIRNFKEHGYDLDEKWSRVSCGGPLQHCCSYAGKDTDKRKAAFLLLRLGANPSLPKKPWRSNIRYAIEGNAQDLFEELLHHPTTNLGDRDRQGQTLLHSIVYTASIEQISQVTNVIHDVDLNIQDFNGFTPLHLAILTERTEVVRKLLTVPGVRLDVADKQGRTPFTLATYWGFRVMALALIEHSQAFPVPEANKLSGLVYAAIHQQKDFCTSLLEMSSYRNLEYHMDLSGKCILHHAAINNWGDVLDSCLRLGKPSIEINQMDHSGRSAMHYAATLGNVDSCLVLVRHGANLTLQDRNGRTSAQAAADAGFKDVLMVLLKSGRVNPNQCDLQGRNLVHWAATLDCVDVMERVVNAPGVGVVELERHDKNSKMPIDIAFQCKCRNVGQFLADKMRSTSGYFNIYDWDNMYCSPDVTDGDRPKKPDTEVPDWLRKKREEEKEERRRYPHDLWSLVIREKDKENEERRENRRERERKKERNRERERERERGREREKDKFSTDDRL
ncbi:hypothetical protein V495_08780 [Pseudogymnoascus sp. VKM F-4514 (FW-929)]|nr:hypothetical protein V495_08780 [Pseudogymnoascus sp. VKM F-4514 (FW-929)]KFY51583.1 hypothetical protein V497_09009 [Pseudogymnoascus sp. VKM F-4516 (FW-969)]